MKYLKILAIVASYLVFMLYVVSFYQADLLDSDAKDVLNKDAAASYNAGLLATSLNPYEPSYKITVAKAILVSQNKSKDQALSSLNLAIKTNPNNLATLRNSAPYFYYLAVKDLTLPSSDANLDPQYVAIAKQHFDRLVQTYPYDVGVLVLAAKYQKKLGLTADYISTTERIRLLRPDLLEWALN